MLEIINDAARAYQGVIPADRWHEPYMGEAGLKADLAAGVRFWGWEEGGRLLGVMGLQDVRDVTLIRHAYVRSAERGKGIGSRLLTHLKVLTRRPVLVGTWAAAEWAVLFYERHGFRLLPKDETVRLLKAYWDIPERQTETSVVLADAAWLHPPLARVLGPAWAASALVLAGMAAATAWAWGRVGERPCIPVHWGLDGRPNGFAGRAEALLAMPGMALALTLLLGLLALADPRLKRSEPTLKAYRAAWLGVLGLLGLVHACILLSALGHAVPVVKVSMAGVGGLLLLLGLSLRQLEPNNLIGIRTPATLADEAVWRRVHATAAYPMAGLGGLLALAALLGAPPAWLLGLLLAGLALLTAGVLLGARR
jgi:uncharacterized membrane protein/GNAT superfamily N-acetyltransferase